MNFKNIGKTKKDAIAYLKQAKEDKRIPEIARDLGFDPSWAYKVAGGTIRPSLERCLSILKYKGEH